MKVYLGPFKNWIGPYQIVDAVFFWQKKYPSDELAQRWDYRLSERIGDWLASTWVMTVCKYIHKLRGDRNIKIRIDDYDAWNVDGTLAVIILPLLIKLRENKHGSGIGDMDDVPDYMRTTNTEEYDDQECFEFYRLEDEEEIKYNIHDRWNWVLDEMIWAFEQLNMDDWDEQYWKVKPEIDLSKHPEDEGQQVFPVRWKVEGNCDWEGRMKHQDRISNGLRLFGKYYQNLWD